MTYQVNEAQVPQRLAQGAGCRLVGCPQLLRLWTEQVYLLLRPCACRCVHEKAFGVSRSCHVESSVPPAGAAGVVEAMLLVTATPTHLQRHTQLAPELLKHAIQALVP